MKYKLIKQYQSFPPGSFVDFPWPVMSLLIQRGMIEQIEDKDLDRDGKAEGGERGEKKAFSRPPQGKGKR